MGDVVYTVVSSNPQTHTFEVCHPISGQTKVFHCNLLQCVKVLPDAGGSACHVSSIVSVGNEAVDSSSEQHTQPASLTPSCASDENEEVHLSAQQLTLDCAVDHTVHIICLKIKKHLQTPV